MRIEGDFEVVSRGDNRVTLRPTGDIKVLDGSFDLVTTKDLKDKVHAVINLNVENPKFYEEKAPFSDEELRETAVQEVWSKRGGIGGSVRPKDDDAEVVKLFDELKGYRDDDDFDNDIFLAPLARKHQKEAEEKREKEGVSEIGIRKDGEPSNFGGVSETEDERKKREVEEEARKRAPNVPPIPGATSMADAFKAKETI